MIYEVDRGFIRGQLLCIKTATGIPVAVVLFGRINYRLAAYAQRPCMERCPRRPDKTNVYSY